jgi:hypothetical protein
MQLFELSMEWLAMVIQDALITTFIYVAGICFVTGILAYTAYKRVHRLFPVKPKAVRHERKD